MLILVTNDDGIQSPGLHVLVEKLREIAEVIVVAPDREQSASSHSISLSRPLRLHELEKNMFSVDGTPTDCVVMGMGQVLSSRPDIVVSGINSGPNLGDDVHYSGTVSAAFEGTILGIKSMAVSLVHAGTPPYYFETAANFALKFCKKLTQETLPQGLLFNINIPNVPPEKPLPYAFTRQGKRNYGGEILEKTDPRGKKYYWIGGNPNGFYEIEDSDCSALAAGKIAITPLQVDMTDNSFNDQLKNWDL